LTRLPEARALAFGAATILGVLLFATVGAAALPDNPELSNVAQANLKAAGYVPAPKLSKELQQVVWAQGGTRLENPEGIVTDYGYENDVPSADDPTRPQMIPTSSSNTEAQKTEPDKNTYLVFRQSLKGADSSYKYGTHFVFQGHENGATVNGVKQGLITRVNLDADAQHRVTLLASRDVNGNPIATIDGSTWDPWAKRLLFTTESPTAPTYSATPDYPSQVEDVSGALGRGGYEGIQDDSAGNIWIVEDIGGGNKAGGVSSRLPNSFLYRYVPKTRGDLHNGKLQVLQVLNTAGTPITQASQTAINAPDQVLIHSYGHSLATKWITIHDTATDGTAPFNANTLAKAADGTPFKRPENGLFRPGSDFKEFFFSETGDTNALSTENGNKLTGAGGSGGWGTIQKLTQSSPSANTGKLSLFFLCNENVTGLDNNAFLSQRKVAFVEDAGDTLHQQRSDDTRAGVSGVNAGFDSGWVFDVNTNYANPDNKPVRWLAQGRDAAATIDAANGGFGGKNDQDNEITGIHVSDGDIDANGILGAKAPHLFRGGWRWFYTQQHGDNFLFEVIPAGAVSPAGDDQDD
jgi:hypothetical protein